MTNKTYTIDEVVKLKRDNDAQIGTTDIRDVKLGAVVEGKKRVPVAGRPDWVWVTIDGRSNTQVKRGRSNINDRYGRDVTIGKEAGNAYYTLLEAVQPPGNNPTEASGVATHASQHGFPLRWRQPLAVSEVQDPVFIRSRQIEDLLIKPSSGFTFTVLPGLATVNGTELAFPDGLTFTVDDSEVPATPGEAVISRVELDDTGTILLSYGAAYAEPVTEQGAIDNAPPPTANTNTIGYLWLPEGMVAGAFHHILPASLAERTGGQGVGVQSVVAGTGISVDNTDPQNPIINASGGIGGDYILIREKQAQNTSAGTFTQGAWQTRVLNEELADTGGHASIASNQITLATGAYRLRASAPAFLVGRHQTRFQDITNTATVLTGTSEVAGAADSVTSRSWLEGRFTVAGSTVFEVQHQCQTTRATDGFGLANNFTDEIYTLVELIRE